MTGVPELDLFLFLTSLFSAILIAVAEFAVTSASRSRLESLAEREDRHAILALRLKDRDEDLQGATQIATLFLTIFAALLLAPHSERAVQEFLRSGVEPWLLPLIRTLAWLVTAVVMTGVFLVTVNLVAKSLGERYGDALVLRVATGLFTLTRLLHLPQRLLTVSANILLKPFSGRASFREAVTSEENLMDILEDGAKTGLLDQTEHELIESIFQFTDTTAREVMIPRTDVVAVDITMPAAGILDTFLDEGFTRMPVYRDSLDDILGVVYAKDVISLIQHPELIVLQDIIRPAYIVPETKPISELLREFQLKRLHMAIVVDEFGGTEGLITMEDILEEIVGEIRDEYDEEEIPYTLLPDGGIEVEAMVNISDFNSFSDVTIPESEDYDTVGGFVTMLFGRIPEAGDSIDYEHTRIEVLEAEERRVIRVRLHREENGNGTKNGD
ncbi:hemolysin family protein [bacterium]|nr:hemolysin family protein [bacterium]